MPQLRRDTNLALPAQPDSPLNVIPRDEPSVIVPEERNTLINPAHPDTAHPSKKSGALDLRQPLAPGTPEFSNYSLSPILGLTLGFTRSVTDYCKQQLKINVW
jgi:hypothetical protein